MPDKIDRTGKYEKHLNTLVPCLYSRQGIIFAGVQGIYFLDFKKLEKGVQPLPGKEKGLGWPGKMWIGTCQF